MRFLILGAGPAGLSFANRLKQLGEDSFFIIEKQNSAGGLCRSSIVDGSPFDIGGGHFLDVSRPNVNRFLFEFMPENEWERFNRNSQISINNGMINSPIEANIWQMGLEEQIEYLKSIAVAGCNLGEAIPNAFVDWIYWKLGNKIANDYMIPYNKKMFADDLNNLGTYWLDKLPNVSFEETLMSCLTHKAYGTQPGHTQFYYPKKYGYGELWLRMANKIRNYIKYGETVSEIHFLNRSVKTKSGNEYQADYIVNTIPWVEFKKMDGIPMELQQKVRKLKYSGIETRFFNDRLDTNAQWIYYPDEKLPFHRILVRHNFCNNSKGYWTETRKERVCLFRKGEGEFSYINEYAYPINTLEKPIIMKELLGWCEKHHIYGLGRWGEHQHYNSDVTVDLALKKVEEIRADIYK